MTRTYPTRRKRRDASYDPVLVLFFLLLCLGILASVTWGLTHITPTETEQTQAQVHKITHDSLAPTYTYDGEVIRWYVFTDPDTDVQYLVNDRGGCTPRLGID